MPKGNCQYLFSIFPNLEFIKKNAKNIKKYFRFKKKCIDKIKKAVYNSLVNEI